MRRSHFLLILAVVVALAADRVQAVPIVFTIDSGLSSGTLSGDVDGSPLVAQGPGGLGGAQGATFFGTISVDLDSLVAPTTITFLSAVLDRTPTGQFLPQVGGGTPGTPGTPADADLGYTASPGGVAYLYAVRDLTFSAVSSAISVVGTSFDSTLITTVQTGGTFAWNSAVSAGSLPLGVVMGPNLAGPGSLVISGGIATLTIPILFTANGEIPGGTTTQATTALIVATATVPEPGVAGLLAVAGALSLGGWKRRLH
jgi:hypothetical protein